MVLACGLIRSERKQRLLAAREEIPRERESGEAGGRAKAQGSGPQPESCLESRCMSFLEIVVQEPGEDPVPHSTRARATADPLQLGVLQGWARLALVDEGREPRAAGRGRDKATSGKHGRAGHPFTERQQPALQGTTPSGSPSGSRRPFSRWGASGGQPDQHQAARIPQGQPPAPGCSLISRPPPHWLSGHPAWPQHC